MGFNFPPSMFQCLGLATKKVWITGWRATGFSAGFLVLAWGVWLLQAQGLLVAARAHDS